MSEMKFDLKNYKQMLDLREGFAGNRHKEKIVFCDHQFGNSEKLAGKKHNFKKEVMVIQDTMNEKQHGRKMEQIKTIAKSRGVNI